MSAPESLLKAIQDSPRGAQVGAFFDFDGTIIDGFSAGAFVRERLRNKEMSRQELAQAVLVGMRNDLREPEFTEFMKGALRAWVGRDESVALS